MKKSLIFLILAVLISSVGILALLRQGFFLTDDGNSMIIRFSAFYENIRDGQFPVRFLSRLNFGYGYPVADFLYPLFMYIGVPIKALGFSFVDTIKIILGLSFLSGAFFSFLWLRKLFDNKAALVGSIAYSLFPYHLFDLYKRGSVGEVLALGVVPFILWSIERRNLFFASLGYGLLITAHNSLALLFLPIIFVYHFISEKKVRPLSSLFFGLGLSAFFWLPALFDKQFTIFDAVKISNFENYFIVDQSLALVGLSFFVSLVFAFFLIPKKNKKLNLFFVVSVFSFFMSLPISTFIWKVLPIDTLIQFPFRFLSLSILSSSFILAFAVFNFKARQKIFLLIFLLAIVLISSKGFLVPAIFQNYPDTFYSTNQDTTTVKNEYMPKWVKTPFSEMAKSKVENLDGEEKINLRELNANKIVFDTFLADNRKVRVNTVYFPGWNAYTNGRKSNIIYDEGFIDLNLGRGKNSVLVKFEETPIRLVADFISAFSLFALLVLSFRRFKF